MPDSKADERYWRTINDNPKEPTALRVVAETMLTILALGTYLLSITRATGRVFHWWPWGPTWLSWITLAAFAMFVVAGLAFVTLMTSPTFEELLDSLSLSDDGEGLVIVWGLFAACASLPGAGLLSIRTLIGWVDLPVLLVMAAISTGGTIGLFLIIRRRMWAIANPFRTLLKLDKSVIRVRSTVISHRDIAS